MCLFLDLGLRPQRGGRADHREFCRGGVCHGISPEDRPHGQDGADGRFAGGAASLQTLPAGIRQTAAQLAAKQKAHERPYEGAGHRQPGAGAGQGHPGHL